MGETLGETLRPVPAAARRLLHLPRVRCDVPDVTRLALFGGVYSNSRALAAALGRRARARRRRGVLPRRPRRASARIPTASSRSSASTASSRSRATTRSRSSDGRERLPLRLHRPARQPLRADLLRLHARAHVARVDSAGWRRCPATRRLDVGGRRVLLVPRLAAPDQRVPLGVDVARRLPRAAARRTRRRRHRLHAHRPPLAAGACRRARPSSTSAPSGGRRTTARTRRLVRHARGRRRGASRVELVPVAYDHAALAAEMREERLPEEFVETILTGWWTTCLEILPAKERARGRY